MHKHHELNLTPNQRTVIIFEIESYPEPKALTSGDLQELVGRYGGNKQAARAIGGVSEGFIRQNSGFKPKPLKKRGLT